jgi:hypothetical protein
MYPASSDARKGDHTGDVIGYPRPTNWHLAGQRGDPLARGAAGKHVGHDRARAHGVDADVAWAEFARKVRVKPRRPAFGAE